MESAGSYRWIGRHQSGLKSKRGNKFGKFLNQRRLELNLSQQELSELLETTRTAVSRWENGVIAPRFTIEQLRHFCKVLNVSFEDIPS